MKNCSVLIILITMLFLVACQGDNMKGGDVAMDGNFKQIATNFRSESDILVDESAQEYMGEFDHSTFLNDLFEAIFAGKLIAYDFLDNPLSIDEVRYLYSHTDTTEVEDIDTGEMDTVLIVEELNPDDVVKIFTAEDWYFDEESFRLEKKVISMTLTTLKLDLEGEPIGYEILFKVYFNDRGQMQ